MTFNSLTFLVFFCVVYLLFWLMPTWREKKLVLLLASYCFYASWGPIYLLLILFSTFLDWRLAGLIDTSGSIRRRKVFLLLSVFCHLIFLGYFKYGSFLTNNFLFLLAPIGVHVPILKATRLLPIGISFYTFASISYIVDVYRREIRAHRSFVDYGLFLIFFPHLVAGPIVRAKSLLPQIANPRLPNANQIGWGFFLLLFGLFLKIVCADNVMAPVVSHLYDSQKLISAQETWLGLLGFSLQIYYDFCGYSICAIGLALVFGFSFPDNFHHPYAAISFSDFWHRWHISLSTWMRDYIYIPLGGNYYGRLRTGVNIFVTMLVAGMWHGASWMFAIWGGCARDPLNCRACDKGGCNF